jgi:enoyl-CoA hydratase
MSEVELTWEREEIAVLTLNRPESLNSMSRALVARLGELLTELKAEGRARAVILTGAGRGFCSGHDLAELSAEADAGDVEDLMVNQHAFSDLIVQLKELPIPVIAAVNGPAAGGGMVLALAADTRVCGSSARFNAAFVKLGISGCDVGTSYLLPRIVGPTLAFEMMLTGRLIEAEEALRSGMVLRVVPDGEEVAAALEIAESIAAHPAFGVRMTKEVMWSNLDAPDLRSAIIAEDRTQVLCLTMPEARKAVPAILARLSSG